MLQETLAEGQHILYRGEKPSSRSRQDFSVKFAQREREL